MQRHRDYTRKRIAKLVNDLQRNIHSDNQLLDSLLISPPVERIPFDDANNLDYTPAQIGQELGPFWQTFWFKASTTIPSTWAGKRVDLLWNSNSEAALYIDGQVTQGLNPGRHVATLAQCAEANQAIDFHIEMACNGLFGIRPQFWDGEEIFQLKQAEIAIFNPDIFNLYYDLLVLSELEKEDDLDPTFAGQILYQLNEICNTLDINDPATYPAVRPIVSELYDNHNATTTHQLSAVGHAHIDTAWLWPLEETWRKCSRTFSTAVRYMDQYPDYQFACSQPSQYEQIEQRHPELFAKIKQKIEAGQWHPVGGMWVEPDCNVPSGESLCRQFLVGQRYFQQKFNHTCRELWIPDVFGYNGQMPQIMKQSGVDFFLTQKLSWNAVNQPLYQTFNWQGIDGSEVLTHFPPANTYNATARVKELRDNAKNYKENDRSRHSYLLFGIGDGGGGPTIDMLERLARAKDLQGLPQTTIESPEKFFTKLQEDCTDLPVVVGELYFELHRGTYTTQAATKQANRRCEFLLHDIETLAAIAHRLHGADYPAAQLEQLWKLLLTSQFHDILPGSSIPEVYVDATNDYHVIEVEGTVLRDAALKSLANGNEMAPFNTTSFARNEVTADTDGKPVYIQAPAYGPGKTLDCDDQVTLTQSNDTITLENQHLKATLSTAGTLLSLIHKSTGRESLDTSSSPANQLILYKDDPTGWPAWDVELLALETAAPVSSAHTFTVTGQSDLRCEVTFDYKLGKASTLTQTVRLDADARRIEFHTEVDWHESNTMLKAAFPVNARALNATYEMQFGYVERPTHYNNLIAQAQFEVPGHRFADLSEHNFGVALLSDSKYGYHTYANTMHLTLLRSPAMPNSGNQPSDQGKHTFAYAIYPHADTWQKANVVAEALHFNTPVAWSNAAPTNEPYFQLDTRDLVIDTVKKAEDSDAIVLRLYEPHGSRGQATLTAALPFKTAATANILEQPGEPLPTSGNQITINYRPHQIITIILD